MIKFIKYTLFLGILIVSQNAYSKPYRGAGRSMFEKAYKMEKSDPEASAHYYQKAIRLGLNPEINKAAKWRLFYLYKDNNKYVSAVDMLPSLVGAKNKQKLHSDIIHDIAREYGITHGAATIYLKALQLDHVGDFASDESIVEEVRGLLRSYSKNDKFQEALLELSGFKPGKKILVKNLQDCEELSCKLNQISYMIDEDKNDEARNHLFPISNSENLEVSQKFRILYLLAKSYKNDEKTYLALRYYRLAARYASDSEKISILALAAFSLYEDGFKEQARYLAQDLHRSNQTNMIIFNLILRVELDHDESAQRELQNLKPILLQKQKDGKSRSLVKAALKLID